MVLKGNDYVRRIRSTLLRTEEFALKGVEVPMFVLNETKCAMSLKLQSSRQSRSPFLWCQHLIYPQLPIWKVKHIKEVSWLQMSPHTRILTPKRCPFHKQNTLLLQESPPRQTWESTQTQNKSVLSNPQLFQSTLDNNYPLDIFILLSKSVAFCFQPKWDKRSKIPLPAWSDQE